MTRDLLAAGLVLVLLLASTPMVVAAAENPRFETYVPEPTLQPGETTRLTVQLLNDAADASDEVETAIDVHATMRAGETPFTVTSGVRLLGSMADGELRTATFTIAAPADVAAGTYRIPIHLTYRAAGDDERSETTVYATVQIQPYARFEVVEVTTNAPVGGTGIANVTLRNVGSENATDTTVTLQSANAAVTFNGAPSSTQYAGTIAAGETVTITYPVTVAQSAETRPYALTATVSYDDERGAQHRSSLSLGITPLVEQSFSLSNVQSTLRVGAEGRLTFTVTNDGPAVAREAVVHLAASGINVHPLETAYAVGTLAPGQSATVTFPVEISSNAESGPTQFTLTVDYQNRDDEARQSDGLRTRVTIAEERDRFALDPVVATLDVGASGELVLAVTNNGDEPVRNVNAKLFTDDPISASDDEAFIAELQPGETTRVTFGVSVGAGALEKTYPVNLDFQYDVDGETKLSKTYTVPVEVNALVDDTRLPIPIPYLVGGVIVLAIGGYLVSRRR